MTHLSALRSGFLAVVLLVALVAAACAPLPVAPTEQALEPTPLSVAPETPEAPPAEEVPPAEATEELPPASPEAEAPAGLLEGRLWSLVSYAGADGEPIEVLPGTEVTARFDGGALGGSAGCNNYFGNYVLEGERLSVEVSGTTKMACDGPVMEQESAYLAALAGAAAYRLVEDQLEITDADGAELLAFVAVQPASLTGTIWLLTGYNDGKGAITSLLPDTEITAVFGEDGRLSGSAGCNSYSAAYQVDADRLAVEEAVTTLMACLEPEGVMDQEAAYLAALVQAASFQITGDQLEVADADGQPLLRYLLLQPTPLVGTVWLLSAYNNGSEALVTPVAGTELTAVFGDNGIVSGSAGCNRYTAPYALDGNALTLGVPATTRMMCAEPEGVMAQEQAYLAVLPTAVGFAVEGDSLVLTDAAGATVATYTAMAEAEVAPQAAEEEIAPPVGVVWRWVASLYGDGTKVLPTNPENYTLQLLPGREVRALADCNVASGTYALDGNALAIEVAPTTRMACPADSQSDQYLRDVNAAQSYVMDGKDLLLLFADDQGSMRFEPARPAVAGGQVATPGPAPIPFPTGAPLPPAAAAIVSVIWRWERLAPVTGQAVVIDEPTRYEFMLLANGTIRIKADCNSGRGTYRIEGSAISVTVGSMTKVACPPDSLGEEFVQRLQEAASYRAEDGRLYIDLRGDGGTMEFGPVE